MMFGNASALTAFPGRGRRFVKRNAAKAPLGRRAAKGIAAILLALCLLLPTAVAGETAQAVEMEIYLIDPCGGCTGRVGAGCGSCTIMDEIAVRYRELFGEDGLQMHFHNLRMDVDGTDQAALDALMAEAVEAAYSGEEALEMIRRQPFDAMFTDIRMAEIDGLRLIREARELNPYMICVVITAFDRFQYAYQIEGDILFHSVLYSQRDTSTLRVNSVYALGSKASHGCVRLQVEDAQWIYENCESGTVVVVY